MRIATHKRHKAPQTAGSLLACLLLAFSAVTAEALPQGSIASAPEDPAPIIRDAPGQDLSVRQRGGPSLNQAVDQVKRQCKDCRVISAQTKRQGNREVHEIKVLTPDNKVRTFRIQGRTLSSRG